LLSLCSDWRLGATYYSLIFAIFVYVVVYTLVIEQRYRLKALDIVGSTRLQLHAPAPAYSLPPQNLTYCGPANNTIIVNGNPVVQYPCRYLDQYDSVAPFLEPAALFTATRITEYPQTLAKGCADQLTPSCQYVNGNSTTYYVAQPEFFTLLLDHTFSSASLDVAVGAMSMPGKMIGQDGETINPCDDYTAMGWQCEPHVKIGLVNQGADVFPLATLLRAAGIASLEDISTAIQETHRFAGLILVLSVQYSNYYLDTGSFKQSYYSYVYSVQSVVDAEFKAEQPLQSPGSGAAQRTILDRHGLRILVKQSGNVGQFDAATLLITLTSSLGLLAVATLVVDILATRVLPLRALYRQYKQMESIDLPEVNLTEKDLTVLENEDLVNPKPAFLRRLASSINTTRFRKFGKSKTEGTVIVDGSSAPTTPLLTAVDEQERGSRFMSDATGDNGDDIGSRGVSMAEGEGDVDAHEANYAATMQRMSKMASSNNLVKSQSALTLNGGNGVAQAYGLQVMAVAVAAPQPAGAPTSSSSLNGSRTSLTSPHSSSKGSLTGPRRTSAASNRGGTSTPQQNDDPRRGSGISLPYSGSGYGAGASASSSSSSNNLITASAPSSHGRGSSLGALGPGLQRLPMASIASAAADDSDNEA
jgi:ATP P2X receptor